MSTRPSVGTRPVVAPPAISASSARRHRSVPCTISAASALSRASVSRRRGSSERRRQVQRMVVDGRKRMVGRDARRGGHGGEKRWPSRGAWPAMNSRMAIGRRPSGCTRRRASVVWPPAATCRLSRSARTIVPGGRGVRVVGRRALQHDQPHAVEVGRGVGPGVQPANAVVERLSPAGSSPALPRPSSACARRWPGHRPAVVSVAVPSASASTTSTSSRAPVCERSVSTASLVSFGADGARGGGEHGARVQLRSDAHDRDAGGGVTGDHGAVHGRGAAVPGQQRGMDVDEAEAGKRQDRVGYQLPVGDDDAEVRAPRREVSPRPPDPSGSRAAAPGDGG